MISDVVTSLRVWATRASVVIASRFLAKQSRNQSRPKQSSIIICLFALCLTFTVIAAQASDGIAAGVNGLPRQQKARARNDGGLATTYPFLTLADIHFDPFLACHGVSPCLLIQKLQRAEVTQWPAILKTEANDPPKYKQDTNYALLTSSLSAAKSEADIHHVQFVILLGDMLGHEFRHYYKYYTRDGSLAHYQIFVKKTLTFLNNELARTFPTLNVYSVVGNNDSNRRDYYSAPHGDFFQQTATLWGSLIKSKNNRETMQNEFPVAGYYAVDIPNVPSLRLIVLNTVLFSYKAAGPGVDHAAMDELHWLYKELAAAKSKKQNVLIAMHIPSGIDIYATLKIHLLRLVNLWNPFYTKQFNKELEQFAPEIIGVLAGHLHSDWTQDMTFDDGQSIPISGTPSISPFFGNSPGFKVYTYVPGEKLEKAETHVLSSLLSMRSVGLK